MRDEQQRLIRPAKCHFCDQPLFYIGDDRYEPEVTVSVDAHGGNVWEFYAHVRCWNAKIGTKTT